MTESNRPPTALGGRTLAEIAGVIVATFAAYVPAIRAGFIWNDSDYVTAPGLQSLAGLGRIWFQVGATEQYYPLLHTAFWVEHRIWGDSPIGYHLLNIALHATSAALLLLVLRRLAIPGAWLAALVFALHPVCVESVAWISEEKNTLSTVFYLLAALAYVRFEAGRSPARYALASGLFAAAVLSKSVTATLPAALLVLAWWRNGSLSWRRDVAPLLPWFAFGGFAGLFSGWVERHYIGAEGSAFSLSALERLLLAGRAAWFYASKLVWPADLIFFYPRWTIAASDPALYACLIAWIAAFALMAAASRRMRSPMAGALFFVGTLFPTLGFFNVYAFVFSYVADHWQYLACLGAIVPICSGLTVVTRRFGLPARFAAAALLTVLGALTWRQSRMYVDMETFYRTTLEKNPSAWMAHNNLGVYLREQKRPGAEQEFEAALAARPDYIPAHYNLGVALLDAGKPREALAQLQQAAGTQHRDEVHLYLGEALSDLNRDAEAEAQFRIATRLEPENGAAWYGLGNSLARQNKLQEAVRAFARAVQADPKNPELAFALGDGLAAAGQYREATEAYRRGLAFAPERVEAINNLGNALVLSGQAAAAVSEFREALRKRPGDAALEKGLKWALETQARGGIAP
jgi:tetratricopeptide (TPR) repeat protein